MRTPPWLATTQIEVAEVLLTRNWTGDVARAQRLLEASLVICKQLGMTALADRATAALERSKRLAGDAP